VLPGTTEPVPPTVSADRPPRVRATPPRRVPRVGAVLELAAGQWQWGNGPLRIRVDAVRVDISVWYGGDWVWVVGVELDPAGREVVGVQCLVAVDAIPDDQVQD
jgi:hypothetical protein